MSVLVSDAGPFAAALRRFRHARRMSQLDLALECGISARHLSFLESGRAQPSREMVLTLAAGLLLPRGAANGLMQAAGFAAAYPASPLGSADLAPLRGVLAELMARHAPNPALLCDRHWTILDASPSARALLTAMDLGDGEMNVIRMLAESPAAPALVENLPEVLADMAGRIGLEALEAGADPELDALVKTLAAACARHPLPAPARTRRPLVPVVLKAGGRRLSFLTAVAHFGTSEDVTVRDLRLELLFPADDETRAAMTAFG
ncbi:MAG: helix-turn-helix transcriptional regulator [Hyphomonadaceae bacterium]|nr:helix-turn-helix transcriptional regulator [Hyphomonadaceae bacterium]